MKLVYQSIGDRIGQAVVVALILFVSDYIEGGYEWEIIIGVPIALFIVMSIIDFIRTQSE